jgi:predicted transcriptional regulator
VNPGLNFDELITLFGIIPLVLGVFYLLFIKSKEILFALFALIIGLVAHITYGPAKRRLSRADLLENDTRSKILNFIEDHPNGTHLREIQRSIGCGVSTLLWHLKTLEDFGLIDSSKAGRYTVFFPIKEKVTTSEMELVSLLRATQAKKIWEVLAKNKKPIDLATIANKTNCHVETARYHVKKFEEIEAVLAIRDSKKILYVIPQKKLKKREE